MSINRGEIYFIDLDPAVGREQAGYRPVLVLSINEINHRPLVVTVVCGTKGDNLPKDYPTNIRVSSQESGLPLETVFMGFQVRSVDRTRFSGPAAGRLSSTTMKRVEFVVRHCLGI